MSSILPNQDICWNALIAHDANGTFFYAVKTTGAFCRLACSARRPLRKNVVFFSAAAAARAAGYQPCKRCQPESWPRNLDLANRVRAVLDACPQDYLTLTQLSAAAHVSSLHLQRLFKRVFGLSPYQYQAVQRGTRLCTALQRGGTVTRIALGAGFHSLSQFYAATRAELGMPPSAFRRKGVGLRIKYATAPTLLGFVLIAATTKGMCRIAFGDTAEQLTTALHAAFACADLIEAPMDIAPFVRQIDAYLQGRQQPIDLPLDTTNATAFQRRVWDALRHIPYDVTQSYAQVAHSLNTPRSVRAIANACAANPLALAISCHRVIQKKRLPCRLSLGPGT